MPFVICPYCKKRTVWDRCAPQCVNCGGSLDCAACVYSEESGPCSEPDLNGGNSDAECFDEDRKDWYV